MEASGSDLSEPSVKSSSNIKCQPPDRSAERTRPKRRVRWCPMVLRGWSVLGIPLLSRPSRLYSHNDHIDEHRVRCSVPGNIDLQPLRRSQSLLFLPPQMVKNKSDVGKLTHGRHVFKRALDTDKIKKDIQRLNEDLKEKKKNAEELVAEKKSDDGRPVFKLAPVPELDTVNLPGQNQEDHGKPAEITVTLRDPALTAAAMAAIVGAEAAAAA